MPVDPLPVKGSRTTPPAGTTRRTSQRMSVIGLTVGCRLALGAPPLPEKIGDRDRGRRFEPGLTLGSTGLGRVEEPGRTRLRVGPVDLSDRALLAADRVAVGVVAEQDVGGPAPDQFSGRGVAVSLRHQPCGLDVERAGAVGLDVGADRRCLGIERFSRQHDRLVGRLQSRAEPAWQEPRFRHAAAIQPQQLVPHLQPGVLDPGDGAVHGAAGAKAGQIAPGLKHPQYLLRPRAGEGLEASSVGQGTAVPGFAFEVQPVRRIGDDGVD